MKSFYEILGVTETATSDEIKKAYKKLAKEHHPDKHQCDPSVEERFKGISEAYQTLSDPEKRKQYDLTRRFGTSGGQYSQDNPFADFNFGGYSGFNNASAQSNGFDGFSDIFENLFRQTHRTANPRAMQRDVESEIEIPFDTAVRGGEINASLSNGEHRNLKIRIPPGTEDGDRMRLSGLGSGEGSRRGNLILKIRVKPHRRFKRTGNDIHLTIDLDVFQAILGTTLQIETVYGDVVKLKIPEGTQNGAVLKLGKMGVKSKKGTGDMLVTIRLTIPARKLNAKQRDLIRELLTSWNEN